MKVEVRYGERTVPIAAGQTVLDAFELAGIEIASSCRAGVCQACVLRVIAGPVPPRSQDGLKDSLRDSGHFLACVARPAADFSCESTDVAPFRGRVAIREIAAVAPDVARVRLSRPAGFAFAAGQFVTLRRDDGLARSYSIASRADEPEFFDIHVRHVPGGKMSGWLHQTARPRDELALEGPKGECTYRAEFADEPLILAGTGTGMAPLVAIADCAVRRGHGGPITLLQGASDDTYLGDELATLARAAPNVRWTRAAARLTEHVLAAAAATAAPRVYLCGSPTFVRDAKKRLFLAGLSMRRIHADPFVGADP